MLKITITEKSIIWSLFGKSEIQSGNIPLKKPEALEKLTDLEIFQLVVIRLNQYWNIIIDNKNFEIQWNNKLKTF